MRSTTSVGLITQISAQRGPSERASTSINFSLGFSRLYRRHAPVLEGVLAEYLESTENNTYFVAAAGNDGPSSNRAAAIPGRLRGRFAAGSRRPHHRRGRNGTSAAKSLTNYTNVCRLNAQAPGDAVAQFPSGRRLRGMGGHIVRRGPSNRCPRGTEPLGQRRLASGRTIVDDRRGYRCAAHAVGGLLIRRAWPFIAPEASE